MNPLPMQVKFFVVGYASKAAVIINVPHTDHTEEGALNLCQ